MEYTIGKRLRIAVSFAATKNGPAVLAARHSRKLGEACDFQQPIIAECMTEGKGTTIDVRPNRRIHITDYRTAAKDVRWRD
jgi:hypothetical protein